MPRRLSNISRGGERRARGSPQTRPSRFRSRSRSGRRHRDRSGRSPSRHRGCPVRPRAVLAPARRESPPRGRWSTRALLGGRRGPRCRGPCRHHDHSTRPTPPVRNSRREAAPPNGEGHAPVERPTATLAISSPSRSCPSQGGIDMEVVHQSAAPRQPRAQRPTWNTHPATLA